MSLFESFDVTSLFTTSNAVTPSNVCPLTEVSLCADDACATVLTEADGFRVVNITDSLLIEIDMNNVFLPAFTFYIEVAAGAGVSYFPS